MAKRGLEETRNRERKGERERNGTGQQGQEGEMRGYYMGDILN